MKKRFFALSSLVLVAGLAFSAQASDADNTIIGAAAASEGTAVPSLAPVAERASQSVVTISVSGKKTVKSSIPEQFRFFGFDDMFPGLQPEQRETPFQALGSGIIIDAEKGYIITNFHVVDGADSIKVTTKDGTEYTAKKIGTDKQSDFAIVQIKSDKKLTAIPFADSDKVRVGDFVLAIGNPFGLGQTVTHGIVSALGRSGLNIENFENFIQTDAAINSGNSGGALVNLKGELVGMNTAIIAPSGGNVGIGFSIPSNMLKDLTGQIVKFGEVHRGFLGIMGGELSPDIAKAFDYESKKGAFVNQVMKGSAAEEAGIKAGDIITSINGMKINSFGELRAKIATMGPGKTIKLGIVRDGKEQTVSVVLKEDDGKSGNAAAASDSIDLIKGAGLREAENGIEVVSVAKGSAAEKMGIKKGDLITGVNRKSVKTMKELHEILDKAERGTVALRIQRGNVTLFIW